MASASRRDAPRILISGAGIAGLTLGILLKERGWRPLIVERDPAMRTEGYMMDFFGTGWDVAERMGLADQLRAIRYPIDRMQFVDREGDAYIDVPISRAATALQGKYVYLMRSDLGRILFERAAALAVDVRFGTTVETLREDEDGVAVTFNDGSNEHFELVIGADGVHSRIRELVFGPEQNFAHYLGGYVAAFHIAHSRLKLDDALKLHEEVGRVVAFYPLGGDAVDATFVFRHPDIGHVPADERLPLLKEKVAGPGWISARVLEEIPASLPVYFDSLTQIRMPRWTRGRVALIGDACGCLTLLAGQGSHLAMADAYMLASELHRHRGAHEAAFRAYAELMQPAVARKQRDAERFARIFIPTERSRPWLRRLTTKLFFSRPLLRYGFSLMGSRSVLENYHA